MHTSFLLRGVLGSLLAIASLAGCAATADEDAKSSTSAATAFPAQCPQFASGHVEKGSFTGEPRGCVIERCQPGWANAEPNDGVANPLMKGTYESGILGMIDYKKDGCETKLATLLAQRSAPASAVENIGEIAGDENGVKSLHTEAVGDHVFRVRVKETNTGLPKPARLVVALSHYETMPYKMELFASRGDAAKKACTGPIESTVRSDLEHEDWWKSRAENKTLDFSAAKVVMEVAGLETQDVVLRDDSYDLFVKVTLADPSKASAVGEPGFLLEVEQDFFGKAKMPVRCEP